MSSERVEALLETMDLRDKAGQLAGDFVGLAAEDEERTLEELREHVRTHRLGSAAPFGVPPSPHDDPEEAARIANDLQRIAVEETPHGVPLLLCADAIHGHAMMAKATVFPHNLGLAAARDPGLVEEVASLSAREIAATGARQTYSPVCDVLRDPRWGRTYETFGESPYLCARLSAAKVRGYQGEEGHEAPTVAATPKHFPAYGNPERGEDASAVDCGPSALRRVFLPPFRAALDAGARAVMPCYNTLDDRPVHASDKYLTELLREEVGFEGVTVSDWNAVWMLHDDQHIAESRREAVRQAVFAGLDVCSIGGTEYVEHLEGLVEEGVVPESRLDESLRRVLSLKERLGLFEDPYVEPERATTVLGAPEHRSRAREAVRRSLTLLKNEDDLLPLDEDVGEVLVTGPAADDLWYQVGGWSAIDRTALEGTTVLEGLREVAGPTTRIVHEPGTGLEETVDVPAAVAAADDADVAVVVLGEGWYVHEFGPAVLTGGADAFPSRHSMSFPDAQQDLLERVHATDTPTVLVTITGRPMVIPWVDEHLPAVVAAYYPGTEGAGVADVLFGRADPGGRLPVSVPRSTGHLPTHFNHLPHPYPVGKDSHPPSYDPLYAFGHGLSYAEFEYESLTCSPEDPGAEDPLEVSVVITNVSDRPGEEVVDLFVTDEYSSRATPVRELAASRRVTLSPGERREVVLTVPPDRLAVVGPDGTRTVEPGTFRFRAGDLEETVTVQGD